MNKKGLHFCINSSLQFFYNALFFENIVENHATKDFEFIRYKVK